MNILISGGTGLVGCALGKKLEQQGHQLFVLTRSKDKAQSHCSFMQTPITWDELSEHPVLSELDYIINLAGANLDEKRWTESFKKEIYSSRIDTTKKLVALANEKCSHLKSFISTSAIAIYGEADDSMASEDYTKAYNFLGKLCQDWESPIGNLKNVKSVIFRLGIVFSDKGGALAEMVSMIRSGLGGTLAGGKQYMSWIDIDDLSEMYIFAMNHSLQGVFNATSPRPETNKTITKIIAQRLGKSALLNIPYLALRIAKGEMAPYIIASQKISPQKIQNKGFHFQYKTAEESIASKVPLSL